MLYKNGCSYIHYTKLSDLWCEYMEYMRSVFCLLGYDIMNVVFCEIVSEWKWGDDFGTFIE